MPGHIDIAPAGPRQRVDTHHPRPPSARTTAIPRHPGKPRLRAWAPKKRSGCDSCKRKRVKCDEQKPVCARCSRARVECRYNPPKTWHFGECKPEKALPTSSGADAALRDDQDFFRKVLASTPFALRPALSDSPWSGSSYELYIHNFTTTVAPSIACTAPFPYFWTALIPQIALRNNDLALQHCMVSTWYAYRVFNGDSCSLGPVLRWCNSAVKAWINSGQKVVPAMVMSRLLGMAMLAIGEWDDARLHRASNVRIYEEVLEDLQADATEREVALLMKKMNIGVQEWYLDRQELSAPEHVDNRYPRLFDGLRIQHESFNDWFFKFDKGVWQDLGVASTFCMMTAHGTLNGAWARCIAPDEEQLPYGYACMQVYEQVKVTREGHPVTAKAERTAFAELSASVDELISEREAYVGNSAKLQRRLNRVKEAFVTEAFILIELHEEGDQLNGGSKWK